MEIKKKAKKKKKKPPLTFYQNQLELRDSPLKWIAVLENWLEDLPQEW